MRVWSKLLTRRKAKLKEALPGGFLGSVKDPDDHLYRSLTGGRRDLSPLTHERSLRIAYYLYETNPLARRILELTKDFVVGEGITYTANEEAVKQLLDRFWNDPLNLWKLKQHNKALELGLYGEQIYPVFVNEVNGHVRLGYIDPMDVLAVVTDPDNCEVIREVVVRESAAPRSVGGPGEVLRQRGLRVVSVEDDVYSRSEGRLVGECFYFAINKVSNATRGRSDLQTLCDWIDGYDRFLFNRLDRAELINAFVWDVEIEDATEEVIERFLRDNPSPTPGSVRAHNNKVRWNAVAPRLQSADAATEAHLIRNQILGGAGIPEHWYAEGGDVNRATALEMGLPTMKRLAARQRYFRYMIEHIFHFVIDQAVLAGTLSATIDTTFQVVLPELSVRDMAQATGALAELATGLVTAESQRWICKDTARRIFAATVGQLGVDVDVMEEQARLAAEGEAKGPA